MTAEPDRLPSERAFILRAAPALALGFVMALSSSAGQTFFISLFSGELRAELNLSHGDFGLLYSVATVASAFSLSWLGKLADRFTVTPLAIAMLVGIACASAGLAVARGALLLGLSLFALRLFGQGMMSHLALTAMGRWFSARRGRALSLASLGFPAGSAVLPITIAALSTVVEWRTFWFLVALFYALVLIPTIWGLGRRARRFEAGGDVADGPSLRDVVEPWTRSEMLRDRRWYGIMLGVLAPPFVVTGVLFHQIHLIETKGWTLTTLAMSYPLFAGSSVAVSLTAGSLVDRFGAVRLLPVYLLPLAAGLFTLAAVDQAWSAPVFMVCFGCTSGAATIVLGALWPELYGTAHLGAIRSLIMSAVVISTALAPGSMGLLIDRGISLAAQCSFLALVAIGCSLLNALLQPAFAAERMRGQNA